MTLYPHGLPYDDIDPETAAIVDAERDGEPAVARHRKYQSHGASLELTDPLVALARPCKTEQWLFDTVNRSLAVRVKPTGGKTFYYYGQASGGENSRRIRLGSTADYTVQQARVKADWAASSSSVVAEPKLRRSLPISKALVEYFGDHSPADSDHFKTVQSYFYSHIEPRFGDRPFSGVSREEWIVLAETIALDQRSRGINFHKSLKALLGWAARRGLLKVNPLHHHKLEIPPVRSKRNLDKDELGAIYIEAENLGQPWQDMVRLVILTGEPIEYVRKMRGGDIDWKRGIWHVEHSGIFVRRRRPLRSVSFTPEALALLDAYREISGPFFPSPASLHRDACLNYRQEIHDQLIELCDFKKRFGMGDVRRGVHAMVTKQGGLPEWTSYLMREMPTWRSARPIRDMDDWI
ncbi:integrase family protein [Notoacmeibacter sp. MSK16QG-6]|uniref:tyrosine-type recombinase/integrase n=1 Tax=Notoacmeibacter sp. MSK16QG-6 TaxID=2957982 RepID=UPI0020A217F5|nr:integrase family protein [Notoacmeibacter sp. MSK16QG-6]MCP1199075.1 integrase family protein [Notoacmeibacter sp. MSK16QG-6]